MQSSNPKWGSKNFDPKLPVFMKSSKLSKNPSKLSNFLCILAEINRITNIKIEAELYIGGLLLGKGQGAIFQILYKTIFQH